MVAGLGVPIFRVFTVGWLLVFIVSVCLEYDVNVVKKIYCLVDKMFAQVSLVTIRPPVMLKIRSRSPKHSSAPTSTADLKVKTKGYRYVQETMLAS